MLAASDTNTHLASFDYDALGRVTRQGDSISSRTMEYDLAGRRTKLRWQDGMFVSYGYDATGAVTAIRENGNAVLASFQYDDLGRRSVLTRGNGVATRYAYDAGSRLARLELDLAGAAVDQRIDLRYNPAGQIVERTAANPGYSWRQPRSTPTRPSTALGTNGKEVAHISVELR